MNPKSLSYMVTIQNSKYSETNGNFFNDLTMTFVKLHYLCFFM